VLLAADLALANARLIWTVPQAEFDASAQAVQRIEAAERSNPSPGPFRVHRMPGWFPIAFGGTQSPRRFRELRAWARDTIHPLIGLPMGVHYCSTIGSFEIDDYVAFFHPRPMPVPPGMARTLGVPTGQPVVYYPRRSFDLWGARYFLLPATPDWTDPNRGFASFLDQTELIHPSGPTLEEKPSEKRPEPWSTRPDWQLRRNLAAYPRAWVVHDAQVRPPASDPNNRARLLRTLIYRNDPIWSEPGRPVFNPRQAALIETSDSKELSRYIARVAVGPDESVAVVKYEPQRVELRAALDRPGLVILADTYYPGWRLTIDGTPARIYRANRMMRGAAVPAGEHTLIYSYEPLSFSIGSIISIAGLLAWLACGCRFSGRKGRSFQE
jgi:hypothetical protein